MAVRCVDPGRQAIAVGVDRLPRGGGDVAEIRKGGEQRLCRLAPPVAAVAIETAPEKEADVAVIADEQVCCRDIGAQDGDRIGA